MHVRVRHCSIVLTISSLCHLWQIMIYFPVNCKCCSILYDIINYHQYSDQLKRFRFKNSHNKIYTIFFWTKHFAKFDFLCIAYQETVSIALISAFSYMCPSFLWSRCCRSSPLFYQIKIIYPGFTFILSCITASIPFQYICIWNHAML